MIFAAQPYGLPLKEVTIAQHLQKLGYKTHAVGKVSKNTIQFFKLLPNLTFNVSTYLLNVDQLPPGSFSWLIIYTP